MHYLTNIALCSQLRHLWLPGFLSHQPQYIFLHDSLLEAVECGVTEVAARDLQNQYQGLCEVNPASGKTGLENRFQVRIKYKATLTPSTEAMEAESDMISDMGIWQRNVNVYTPSTLVHCATDRRSEVHRHFDSCCSILMSQKLQMTLHCRQMKNISTLPVNRPKNRYTDMDMLPCEHTHTHTHMHSYTHTCTHTHVHTHTGTWAHIHTLMRHTRAHTQKVRQINSHPYS